jgi:hypothetical protein
MNDAIARSVDGLRARLVDGVLFFDRLVPVRNMATATVRGLAGHLLREHCPGVADRWFKPGQNGDCPPAYVFQPVLHQATETAQFPFRVIAWDPPNELIPALQASFEHVAGWPFGGGDVLVSGVEWTEVCRLKFEGIYSPPDVQRLVFRTPLRLRRGNDWVTETSLSIGDITGGLVNRVNRLSREYGNGLQLDLMCFMQHAAFAVEVKRSLSFVRTGRRSSTQGQDVDLSGLVGRIVMRGLTPSLSSLLSVGALVHLGKHTAEGCGAFRLDGSGE